MASAWIFLTDSYVPPREAMPQAKAAARGEDTCSMPLGGAAKYGLLEMVGLLSQLGAKANLPDAPEWRRRWLG